MVQKAERVLSPRNQGGTRSGARGGRPVGNVTRGTTNPNRMRRVDRWLTGPQAWRLRAAAHPLAVDLGYGASPATAVELFDRLAAVRADTQVVGIEIEPERVRQAQALERPGLRFQLGGFELPVTGNPVLVRAFNVLRQYEEADVAGSGGWCRTASPRAGCSSTARAMKSGGGPPGWRSTPSGR